MAPWSSGNSQDSPSVIWQEIDPHPTGRLAYLTHFRGVSCEPETGIYRPHAELPLWAFHRPGNKIFKGTLIRDVFSLDYDLPTPGGGDIQYVENFSAGIIGENETVVATYACDPTIPAEVRRFGCMPFKKFIASAPHIYGQSLYRDLTTTISIEELPKSAREKWARALSDLELFTVDEVIKHLQQFVTSHYIYYYYKNVPLAESIFKSYLERAKRKRSWGPDEHLNIILSLQGGVCAELGKLV